jgi:hypothetical protein
MDASDDGLCVLDLGTKHFISLQWATEELSWIRRLNEYNTSSAGPTPHRRRGKRSRGDTSDASELDVDFHMFSIDVREHLSGALAVLLWGPLMGATCRPTHTHIRVVGDNTTSVSWTNKLASSNLMGRNINRALAISQAQFNLLISEQHPSGCCNIMPDYGSRLSDPLHKSEWLRLFAGWTETTTPPTLRYHYSKTWSQPQSGLPSALP